MIKRRGTATSRLSEDDTETEREARRAAQALRHFEVTHRPTLYKHCAICKQQGSIVSAGRTLSQGRGVAQGPHSRARNRIGLCEGRGCMGLPSPTLALVHSPLLKRIRLVLML